MIFYSPSLNKFGDLNELSGDAAPVDEELYAECMGSAFTPGLDGKPRADLETLRTRRINAIIAERDRRKSVGGTKVGEYWFHSDADSRIQQIGLVLLGENIPPGLQWKTMSGAMVPMTPTLAGQVFGAAALADTLLFAFAEGLKAAVMASATPKTVDITSGWPEIFIYD